MPDTSPKAHSVEPTSVSVFSDRLSYSGYQSLPNHPARRLPHCQVLLAATILLATLPFAKAQSAQTPLTFDVATIRLSAPGQLNGTIRPLPSGMGYMAHNITIKLMISLMYKVPMRQIEGGPDWLNTDHYDIEARSAQPASVDDLHLMFQNLLADRLDLKLTHQIVQGPVYALTIEKSGVRMHPNDTPQDFKIPVNYDSNGYAVGRRVPMPYLCWWLGTHLQSDARPVVDQTGLTGNYDFKLLFAPLRPPGSDLPPDLADRPTLVEAVRQQLGLRLQPQTGPVDHYRIDHVERPSPN